MTKQHIWVLLIVTLGIFLYVGSASAGLVPTLTLPNSHVQPGASGQLNYVGHVQAPVQGPETCALCGGGNSGSESSPTEPGSDKISKSSELAEIDNINAVLKKNGMDWTAGETSVSQLTPAAYQSLLGTNVATMGHDPVHEKTVSPPAKALPTSFSWRSVSGKDWTTPIRDQKNCGSCWSFALMGMFESYLEMYNHRSTWNPNFAEQYLLSCNIYGYSCAGGSWFALNHLLRTKDIRGGVGTVGEAQYPYTATKTRCKSLSGYYRYKLPSKVGGHTTTWYYYTGLPSTTLLKNLIYGYGPITVAINADNYFKAYKSGIFDNPYSLSGTNHAVVLYGWGQRNGRVYWLLKNSWGTGWGENGWMRIYAGENNVGTQPAYIAPGPWHTSTGKLVSNPVTAGQEA